MRSMDSIGTSTPLLQNPVKVNFEIRSNKSRKGY